MAEVMEAASFRSSNLETYKAAAARRGLRLSDWLREAADTALEAEGFSTGSPEQQWALVTPAGEVLATILGRRTAADDRGEWLPVENRDSEPFNSAKHWRLKPLPLRLEGGTVIREYPVIVKSLEHA